VNSAAIVAEPTVSAMAVRADSLRVLVDGEAGDDFEPHPTVTDASQSRSRL